MPISIFLTATIDFFVVLLLFMKDIFCVRNDECFQMHMDLLIADNAKQCLHVKAPESEDVILFIRPIFVLK